MVVDLSFPDEIKESTCAGEKIEFPFEWSVSEIILFMKCYRVGQFVE